MIKPIFFNSDELIQNFGVSICRTTMLNLSTIKDFCNLLSEPHDIRIAVSPVSKVPVGNFEGIDNAYEKFIQDFIFDTFEKMQNEIERAEKMIQKHAQSNAFVKAVMFSLSNLVDEKKAFHAEEAQKMVDFLKTKTQDDIRKKINFIMDKVEIYSEQCVAVPSNYEDLKKISHFYSYTEDLMLKSIIDENEQHDKAINYERHQISYKNKIPDTIPVNSRFYFMAKDIDTPYLGISFRTPKGDVRLAMENGEYKLTLNPLNLPCFITEVELLDYLIKQSNLKKSALLEEVKQIEQHLEKLKEMQEINKNQNQLDIAD